MVFGVLIIYLAFENPDFFIEMLKFIPYYIVRK